ncbi:MAG TPA: hypothetical protein PKA82_03710 [Pyrinomonadaceae bacterium]|nr:hypothetical protein [Pyrinomonadaceae bacterium]
MARPALRTLTKRLIITTFLATVISGTIAHACECEIKQPVCYEYPQTDAVFVGEVTEISDDPNIFPTAVKVKVIENFKGMLFASANTWDKMTSCSYSYKKGEKFLFFAGIGENDNSFFSAGLCSRTSRLSEDSADIAQVRLMSSGQSKFTIWATVNRSINVPIQGVEAEVINPKLHLMAKSDSNGDLKIEVPNSGKYLLRVWSPKGKVWIPGFIPKQGGFFDQAAMIRKNGRTRKGEFRDIEIEVKENRCGWVNVSLSDKANQ